MSDMYSEYDRAVDASRITTTSAAIELLSDIAGTSLSEPGIVGVQWVDNMDIVSPSGATSSYGPRLIVVILRRTDVPDRLIAKLDGIEFAVLIPIDVFETGQNVLVVRGGHFYLESGGSPKSPSS